MPVAATDNSTRQRRTADKPQSAGFSLRLDSLRGPSPDALVAAPPLLPLAINTAALAHPIAVQHNFKPAPSVAFQAGLRGTVPEKVEKEEEKEPLRTEEKDGAIDGSDGSQGRAKGSTPWCTKRRAIAAVLVLVCVLGALGALLGIELSRSENLPAAGLLLPPPPPSPPPPPPADTVTLYEVAFDVLNVPAVNGATSAQESVRIAVYEILRDSVQNDDVGIVQDANDPTTHTVMVQCGTALNVGNTVLDTVQNPAFRESLRTSTGFGLLVVDEVLLKHTVITLKPPLLPPPRLPLPPPRHVPAPPLPR